MKSNRIRFGDLEAFLARVGLTHVPSTGPQRVWVHPPSELVIVLPPRDPEDDIGPAHLLAARKHLVDRGVIREETFDRFLESASPASATPGNGRGAEARRAVQRR
jgi:hypothetical protein